MSSANPKGPSLKNRLPLLFVALMGAIQLALFAGLYFRLRDRLTLEMGKTFETQAVLFSRLLEAGFSEPPPENSSTARSRLEEFVESGGLEAEVRRKGGPVLWRSKGFEARGAGSLEHRLAVTARDGEELSATLSASRKRLREPLRDLELYFATVLPVALGAAWVLANLFVARALSPVDEIRRSAERISRANISERVPDPAGPREIRDLARTFNEMLDRLDSAIEDLQNFAADAAHELRTPLANLRAEIDTAVEELRSAEEYQAILGSFGEEVARMNHVVTDLFTLAKIDMRQYAFRKDRVALWPLLREAQETWEALAASRRIRVEVSGSEAFVAGDRVALQRVFMNLVENAIKYNYAGGEVRVRVGRAGDQATVEVSDSGPGISGEHLPKLFRRFYRVDKARSRESGGAGLGLAISKAFIEAHSGTIDVASAPGAGTTFTVKLPASD